jgi:hypothetical protein
MYMNKVVLISVEMQVLKTITSSHFHHVQTSFLFTQFPGGR